MRKRGMRVNRAMMNYRTNKFSAEKTEIDGIQFDSRKEASVYWQLKMAQRAGEIKNLQRQVKYELIPNQRDEKGKVIERAVYYVSDFEYDDPIRGHVVIDVKGFKTKDYIIKRKLMLERHGIRIEEV